jgi:1-acyl-sn-glycerol-3-phosphate acyltransferase
MKERLALVWYALARGLVEVVCRSYWRVKIIDGHKLTAHVPYVIAPVHRSNIDTLLAGCLTRRRIRFMGKDSLWRYGWSGALFSSLGGFPVHRGTPDREALRICEEAVAGGEPVVLFPEGTRQSGPRLHPLFEGAAFVAARARVPLVPVGIGGSEWAMPKGSKRISPVKVVMVVGDPIPPPARSESGRLPRRAVAEMTEQLATELQKLLDQALKAAGRE